MSHQGGNEPVRAVDAATVAHAAGETPELVIKVRPRADDPARHDSQDHPCARPGPAQDGDATLASLPPPRSDTTASCAPPVTPGEPTDDALPWLSTRIVRDGIVPFLDWPSLVGLMCTCRALHRLTTSDPLWHGLLTNEFNLQPLLRFHDVRSDYYRFYIDMVITTAALHSHYTFVAQPPPPPPASGPSRFTGSSLTVTVHRSNATYASESQANTSGATGLAVFGADHSDVSSDVDRHDAGCDITAVNLLLSSASLGQMSHRVGRAQILCAYKSEEMEVLQGSCRFAVARRCFALCCNAFGNDKRGPVFTVAIANVVKPWAGESLEHFASHKGGLRLVMAPVLWEGQSPGSQISERDIIVVSRPPRCGGAAGSGAEEDAPGTSTIADERKAELS